MAITVIWKDPRWGRIVHSGARCVDISDSGARIEYHEALATMTPIQICATETGLVRTGKVRFCTPVSSGYHVGIEFS